MGEQRRARRDEGDEERKENNIYGIKKNKKSYIRKTEIWASSREKKLEKSS